MHHPIQGEINWSMHWLIIPGCQSSGNCGSHSRNAQALEKDQWNKMKYHRQLTTLPLLIPPCCTSLRLRGTAKEKAWPMGKGTGTRVTHHVKSPAARPRWGIERRGGDDACEVAVCDGHAAVSGRLPDAMATLPSLEPPYGKRRANATGKKTYLSAISHNFRLW